MNELVVALAIGILGGCGAWLVLRPRTFQVAIGLALLMERAPADSPVAKSQ